jgi:hypothetical protein
MDKIPRAFTSARHAQRRTLFKACRIATKGSAWRSASGVLFAQRNGWFLAVHEITGIVEASTQARLVLKPMRIDPIFWEILGEPQLRDEALSFRYFGALTCPGLIMGEVDISEEGGPPEIAARMLQLGEERLEEVAACWTIDRFLDGIRLAANPQRLFATAICTLIAEGRGEQALELCRNSASNGQVRGFLTRRGTFPEMAAKYLVAAERRSPSLN